MKEVLNIEEKTGLSADCFVPYQVLYNELAQRANATLSLESCTEVVYE